MFPITLLGAKTKTGLDICIVCDRFGASSSIVIGKVESFQTK